MDLSEWERKGNEKRAEGEYQWKEKAVNRIFWMALLLEFAFLDYIYCVNRIEAEIESLPIFHF